METQRTQVRLLKPQDFKALIEMYLEQDSNKFISPFLNKDKDFFTEFLNTKIKNNKTTPGFWVVQLKENQQIIGTVNLNFFQVISANHIGCHLKKAFWNMGFATELLTELIKYGHNTLGINPIYAVLEKENLASKNLLTKVGFSFDEQLQINGAQLEKYKNHIQ
jgi:ribosomal-protein-alanine N-acetyltransferase